MAQNGDKGRAALIGNVQGTVCWLCYTVGSDTEQRPLGHRKPSGVSTFANKCPTRPQCPSLASSAVMERVQEGRWGHLVSNSLSILPSCWHPLARCCCRTDRRTSVLRGLLTMQRRGQFRREPQRLLGRSFPQRSSSTRIPKTALVSTPPPKCPTCPSRPGSATQVMLPLLQL